MKRNHGLWIGAVLLSMAMVFVGVVIFKNHTLDRLQDEVLGKLEEHLGEYDERSIVLENTNRREAEALAETFGAKLRLSQDGKFATLTLSEGVTVRDVFSARENRKYLEITSKIRRRFTRDKNIVKQLKDYHIYSCPGCGQKIRIPRGKGRIEISCPKCHTKFVKNS